MTGCVYLISQSNGTYVNISFLTMDIDCQEVFTSEGLMSDYIEIRDGSSQDSPLMGRLCGNGSNVPAFVQSTQNHLRFRLEKAAVRLIYNAIISSLPRFFSNFFGSGSGFQLEYNSTNVSQWTFRSGTCGGSFKTPQGIFTSPSYPDNYPDNADCIYTISQANDTAILLKILSMDFHSYNWNPDCQSNDYIEIRDGPSDDSPLLDKLCGSDIPAPIQTSNNQVWIK